ncbi:MAG: hypothetical protein ABH816_01285 [Candidatus Levyibacteriota bacterium]
MDWNKIVDSCVVTEGEAKNIATLACLPALFQNLIYALLFFSTIVAVFLIIYSGIKFITSGGDPKQVEGARHTMTYAIVGLIIIFLSFFIINLIAGITGAECIKIFGFGNCLGQ